MTVLKSSVVFAVVFALTHASKKIHSRSKYFLWVLFFASLIILPVFSVLVESFDIGITREIKNEQISEAFIKLSLSRSGDLQVAGAYESAALIPSDKTIPGPRVVPYWPFLGLCVWVLGILILSSRLLAGTACLTGFKKNALPVEEKKYGSMLNELSRGLGIRGDISLLQSDKCKVPFACGVFRPLIHLPSNLREWPSERVRDVLSHELIHIKQKDYAAKLFTRVMCSLFWFIPFMWIAYANLCAEQEQACDAMTVEHGTHPARYARALIRIARFAREQLPAAYIFISNQKESLLRKRILSILEIKGGKKMKTKILLCGLIFLIALLAGVGSFAADKEKIGFYVPKRNEEIYGTWVNKNYDGIDYEQIIVYYYWGYGEFVRYVTDKETSMKFSFTIVDKWSDSEGNIWYKTYEITNNDYSIIYTLNKISNDATVFEYVDNVGDFPTRADLNKTNYNYRIRYRQ
jgi:beta-lactamase regulating signal transducer with metallopeptidase domain